MNNNDSLLRQSEKSARLSGFETASRCGGDLLSLHTIQCIDNQPEFAALELPWKELSVNCQKCTVFNSWSWLYTWWEIYQKNGNRRLFILTCKDHHGNLLGVAPFQIVNQPKRYFPCNRQILFLGTGETSGSLVFGEYSDLLIREGHESSVLSAFSDFLYQQRARWDGAKFQQLLQDSYLSRLFSARSDKIVKTQQEYGVRTLITLPENYAAYLQRLQKKMRNNITRIFSRINAEQDFSFETTSDPNRIDATLDLIADLDLNQRGTRNLNSVFACKNFVAFHHRLARRISEESKLLFTILYFAKEPVAVLYSFIDGDTLHFYQSGVRAEYAQRYSLMTTLLSQQIRESIEHMPEIRSVNFMFSETENTYKKRFWSETEPMYLLSFDQKGIKYSLYRWLHGPVKRHLKRISAWLKSGKKA